VASNIAPGLVTGTSSEYLGARPVRRIFRERPVIIVLGPRGVGKSAVAERLASFDTQEVLRLDTARINDELVRCVRRRGWAENILKVQSLILDGPERLHQRPACRDFVRRLVEARAAAGLRTVVCEAPGDASAHEVLSWIHPGSAGVLGLRFPLSRSGRLRVARRMCEQLGFEKNHAAGTDLLEPWGYDRVLGVLGATGVSQTGA
jgi:hypothetical protein